MISGIVNGGKRGQAARKQPLCRRTILQEPGEIKNPNGKAAIER